jgi:hypothetical protein
MKVDHNFRPVYLKSLSGNRFASYHLSPSLNIDRIRVQRTDHKSTARCSDEMLEGLMSGRSPSQPGLLIGLASDCLPKSLTHWVEHVGLGAELHTWVREIVFGSHIHTAPKNEWVPGFLIDATLEEKSNPYCFPSPLVNAVTRSLSPHPYQTVFLNYSHPNGKPLTGLEHFTFLAYAIGYLKFASNEMDYKCKKDLANVFMLSMAGKLPEIEKVQLKELLAATLPEQKKAPSRQVSGEYRRKPPRT